MARRAFDFGPVVEEGTPLWMPKGSVRAIITLFIVLAGGALFAYMLITGRYNEIPEAMFILYGGVIGAYFVDRRGAENATKQAVAVAGKVDEAAGKVEAALDRVDLLAASRRLDLEALPGPPWEHGGAGRV